MQLPGYSSLNILHSGKNSIVYRGQNEGKSHIIKLLNKEYPTSSELERFQNEFKILSKVDDSRIVKPIKIESFKNSLMIIFEDIEGTSLNNLQIQENIKTRAEVLRLSIEIGRAIGNIHDLDIVHNDIKSQNIVFNQITKQINLIDFGSATLLTQQNAYNQFNESIVGTLAHISPEQTGRMNRSIDYRTDYYSYGILLYKLFSGEYPFLYPDPLAMVHAHLAKVPPSPKDKYGVPSSISKIILKLLQKNPEDRYQSAVGFLTDLERCFNELETRGSEALDRLDFPLGEKDFSRKFQIPQKIYGRDQEIDSVLQGFKKSVHGHLCVALISGASGLGKSVLIQEINKSITEFKGYFISGKYDPNKRSIPYRAITQALKTLIAQIQTESNESIEKWKSEIEEAVGNNGKILTDVIPELESLIGKQPAIPDLAPAEAQNRFNFTFIRFLRVFARAEHPVSLFLDDLQWVDIPSIQLLQTIISSPDLHYLYIVLSFRDNEVSNLHPFNGFIQDLEHRNLEQRSIRLTPLTESDVTQLVADTLNLSKNNATELAKILHNRTGGNPFHVNEVFKSLYEKGFIFIENNAWKFDILKISEVAISENVIDLLVEKIQLLPPQRIELLKMAASVGNWFRQDIFVKIYDRPGIDSRDELIQLANDNFFILGSTNVNFVHDKVQEAVYTLISPEERAKNHYKIAQTYLSLLDQFKLEDHIFTIVNQLNQARSLLGSDAEMERLIELNLMAGDRSLASTAHEAAYNFYKVACDNLDPDRWDLDDSRYLKAYSSLARSAYLSRRFEEAEVLFGLILKKAKHPLEKVQVYEMLSSMYVSQNKMIEVLDVLKQALKLLGLKLPMKPTQISPLPDILKFQWSQRGKSISDLKNLPRMKDEISLIKMKLLNAAIAPAFLAQPDLFPVLVLKMVILTLDHGISPLAPFAFTGFGMIQGFGLGNYQRGYELGRLAFELNESEDAKPYECRTLFLFACMINHWKHHAVEGVSIFERSFRSGMETGDLQYSSYSLNNIHFQGILRRQSLDSLEKSFNEYESSISALNQHNAFQLFSLNRQYVANLRGESKNFLLLDGDYFQEEKVIEEWLGSSNSNALFDYYLCKARLSYFGEDYRQGYEYHLKASEREAAMFSMMFIPENLFFGGLLIGEILEPGTDLQDRKKLLKELDRYVKRFQVWAINAPSNYGHKYKILRGIQSELKDDPDSAKKYYREAIRLAQENKYLLEEGLANELLARIFLKENDSLYVNVHIHEAYYAFSRMGMESKCTKLETKHPFLKRKHLTQWSNSFFDTLNATNQTATESSSVFLDFHSILKASQAISGEIQLGKLLEKLLQILFENAGAERGLFLFKENDSWFVQAEGSTQSNQIRVLERREVFTGGKKKQTEDSPLSINILNYVIHTKDLVILNNAENDPIFLNDDYIKANHCKSILCYPILNHGDLTGIIYLENNLVLEAFTKERIQMIKILSSQISISLENSLLYRNLEKKVLERTKSLNDALIEVRGLKENQDLDYFLTSLLLEPLGQNRASSPAFDIRFFTEQKKKFQFKNHISEIGGDISISGNILLDGKKYLAVLNGDAMGKSLQGAGGALVLGSVFTSILARPVSAGDWKDPGKWILETFRELQYVFQTFDGSMLVTAFIGLLDESGNLYYMISDHPSPILLRDGQASFLTVKKRYPKFGIAKWESEFQAERFQMRPGDVILVGSDGKDDLIKDKDQNEFISTETDNLILKIVEKTDSVLPNIVEALREIGDLFDDISLVRIEFLGPAKV